MEKVRFLLHSTKHYLSKLSENDPTHRGRHRDPVDSRPATWTCSATKRNGTGGREADTAGHWPVSRHTKAGEVGVVSVVDTTSNNHFSLSVPNFVHSTARLIVELFAEKR